MLGQQPQATPSVGLLQNPPPNLNKPPPKMVSHVNPNWSFHSNSISSGTLGGNENKRLQVVLLSRYDSRNNVDPAYRGSRRQSHDSAGIRSLQQATNQASGAKAGSGWSNENGVSFVNRTKGTSLNIRILEWHRTWIQLNQSPINFHSFRNLTQASRHSQWCILRSLPLRGIIGKLSLQMIRQKCLMIAKLIPKF